MSAELADAVVGGSLSGPGVSSPTGRRRPALPLGHTRRAGIRGPGSGGPGGGIGAPTGSPREGPARERRDRCGPARGLWPALLLDHRLDEYLVDPSAAGVLRQTAARRHDAPIGFTGDVALIVAIADPTDSLGLSDIAVMTKLAVRPAVAARSQIIKLLDELEFMDEPLPAGPRTVGTLIVPPDESSSPAVSLAPVAPGLAAPAAVDDGRVLASTGSSKPPRTSWRTPRTRCASIADGKRRLEEHGRPGARTPRRTQRPSTASAKARRPSKSRNDGRAEAERAKADQTRAAAVEEALKAERAKASRAAAVEEALQGERGAARRMPQQPSKRSAERAKAEQARAAAVEDALGPDAARGNSGVRRRWTRRCEASVPGPSSSVRPPSTKPSKPSVPGPTRVVGPPSKRPSGPNARRPIRAGAPPSRRRSRLSGPRGRRHAPRRRKRSRLSAPRPSRAIPRRSRRRSRPNAPRPSRAIPRPSRRRSRPNAPRPSRSVWPSSATTLQVERGKAEERRRRKLGPAPRPNSPGRQRLGRRMQANARNQRGPRRRCGKGLQGERAKAEQAAAEAEDALEAMRAKLEQELSAERARQPEDLEEERRAPEARSTQSASGIRRSWTRTWLAPTTPSRPSVRWPQRSWSTVGSPQGGAGRRAGSQRAGSRWNRASGERTRGHQRQARCRGSKPSVRDTSCSWPPSARSTFGLEEARASESTPAT